MRLIDADALPRHGQRGGLVHWQDIENAPTFNSYRAGYEQGRFDEAVRLGLCGRWEVAGNTTHYFICSICGKPGDYLDNYCRSCGAKMKGADDE